MGLRVFRRSHLSVPFIGSSTTQGAILGLEVGCWVLVGDREALVLLAPLDILLLIAVPAFRMVLDIDSSKEVGGGVDVSDHVFGLNFCRGGVFFFVRSVRGGDCSCNWFWVTWSFCPFLARFVLWWDTSLSMSWMFGNSALFIT